MCDELVVVGSGWQGKRTHRFGLSEAYVMVRRAHERILIKHMMFRRRPDLSCPQRPKSTSEITEHHHAKEDLPSTQDRPTASISRDRCTLFTNPIQISTVTSRTEQKSLYEPVIIGCAEESISWSASQTQVPYKVQTNKQTNKQTTH